MSSMNLMYKYVELNSDIYLGYIIFCLKHVYMIKHNLRIFTSEGNLYFFGWEKTQWISIIPCNHSLILFHCH